MLSRDQIDLIQQEIDGANTPEGSAALRSLMEQNPEAGAMAVELRRVAALFGQVAEREPPARLKRAILDALPQPARASPGALLRWAAQVLRSVTKPMEETVMTKKAVLIGSAAVAVVIVVAGILTGFPPGFRDAGTIGGVQPAARYHGRVMADSDVSLKNPEIQALFQNDKVLQLVRSDVFRQAMQNQAFQHLMASDAFRQILASDAFRHLMENDFYRRLMADEAFRGLQASAAFRELQDNELFRRLLAQDAFRQMESSDAMQRLQENELYLRLQANAAFRDVMASDAFRSVMENDLYRSLLASDAFRTLEAAEAFRALAQSQALSQAFMRETMRAQM